MVLGGRLAVLALLCMARPLASQEIIDNSEHLDSDRPEAWAMNYFTSVTLLSGLAVPRTRRPLSLEAGAELGWVPQLSLGERTVGFNGTKEEALNHSTVFARPRLTLGLPWRVALTLSYVPPVEVAGVRPHLFAFALERPLYESGPARLGARLSGQVGQAKGAFTCSGAVAAHEPGSAANPYGCDEPSSDKAIQRYLAFELGGAVQLDRFGGLTPWLAVAGNFLDTEVRVQALTFGVPDRSVLDAETWTFSASAGVVLPVTDSTSISIGAFYTPLDVVRHAADGSENDGLLNLRAYISHDFH